MGASGVLLFDEPDLMAVEIQGDDITDFLLVDPPTAPSNVLLAGEPEQDFLLFSVGGPPGPKGDKGDPGDTGPQGPPGAGAEEALAAVETHIQDTTPHPAYDDLPSLVLRFENGLL